MDKQKAYLDILEQIHRRKDCAIRNNASERERPHKVAVEDAKKMVLKKLRGELNKILAKWGAKGTVDIGWVGDGRSEIMLDPETVPVVRVGQNKIAAIDKESRRLDAANDKRCETIRRQVVLVGATPETAALIEEYGKDA